MSKTIILVGSFDMNTGTRPEVDMSRCFQEEFGYRTIPVERTTPNVTDVIIKFIKLYNPNYCFIFGGKYLDIDKLDKNRGNTLLFNQHNDFHLELPLPWYKKLSQICDASFWTIPDPEALKYYHDRYGRQTQYLMAPYKYLFFPKKMEKKFDIVFLGTMYYKERKEIITKLIENGLSVTVFGKGGEYGGYRGNWGNLSNGPVYGYDANDVINSSKIVLNLRMDIPEIYYSNRMFIPMAAKVASLTQWGGRVEEIFKENRDTVYFHDIEDAVTKAKYLLENDQEREKLAQTSYESFVKNFNLIDVIKYIDNQEEIVRHKFK